MILAGIDEAGYGPTLGPLVVSVSVFRVSDEIPRDEIPRGECGVDLWTVLEGAVCRKPDGHRIPVNDSKKLFHQKKGLRDLEEGIFPFLCVREAGMPRDLRSLLAHVARRGSELRGGSPRDPAAYLDAYPWYRGRNVEIPVDTYPNFVESRARELRDAMARSGVEFLGLAAWPIEVLEFNTQLARDRSKATVSFRAVGSFLKRLWKQFPHDTVEVMVDRQGGRMHYGPLLFEKVRPRGIRIEAQGPELSTYHLSRGRSSSRQAAAEPPWFRVSFCVESESRSLPVALASMLSKYLREVHMILFNGFWRELRADLKPTAGYALDARRFLEDISPLRRRLGIDDAILVRKR